MYSMTSIRIMLFEARVDESIGLNRDQSLQKKQLHHNVNLFIYFHTNLNKHKRMG